MFGNHRKIAKWLELGHYGVDGEAGELGILARQLLSKREILG